MALKTDLAAAAEQLAAAGIESALLDAQLLAAHLMGASLSEVRKHTLFDAPTPAGFFELIELRAQRIPLQHLTGKSTFRHVELRVGPGVFIPRPETELVAQAALDEIERLRYMSDEPAENRPNKSVNVVDLCTGSGAIACAIAHEVTQANVVAVELETEAHAWAQLNCDAVITADGSSLRLLQGDATTIADPGESLEPLRGAIDVVVTNPPYIPSGQVPTDHEVRDHDPATALYGQSEDGLAVPRAVAKTAWSLLRNSGLMVMEHGHGQQQQLLTHLCNSGWTEVVGHQDYAGKERYVSARRPGSTTHSAEGGRLDP